MNFRVNLTQFYSNFSIQEHQMLYGSRSRANKEISFQPKPLSFSFTFPLRIVKMT